MFRVIASTKLLDQSPITFTLPDTLQVHIKKKC